jgi:hypothetical protein
MNEYIKSTCDIFMPVYVKLFNIIFDSGNVPESWLVGTWKYYSVLQEQGR